MKNKIIAFISACLCISLFLVPCIGCALVADVIEIIAETIFSETTRNLQDITSDVLGQLYEDSIKSYYVEDGELKFSVPNFDIVTGKVQLQYEIVDPLTNETTNKDDVLLEATLLLTPNGGATIDTATNIPLFSNGINLTITRTSVSPQHYFIRFPNNFNYDRQVTFANDSISISGQSGCTVFKVDKGDRYTEVFSNVLYSNFYCETIKFTTNNINAISVSCNAETMPTASQLQTYCSYPSGIYSNRGNNVSASEPLNYPTTVDLLHGSFMMIYPSRDPNSGNKINKTFNCFSYFTTGFVITNNSTHSRQIESYYTNNYEQNYYIYPITGGTIVDKDNYTDVGLPSLSPVFDLDPSLPSFDLDLLDLLPALLDLLDGDLLPDLADLLLRLLDFFGHMPDIDTTWNPDTTLNTNNYWELDFPSDDSGSGSSGYDITVNVTVDITRPLVTTYTYIDPIEIETLPVITTYTMPVAVQEIASDTIDSTTNFLNNVGVLPVYAFLTLIGVGIAIILKGV